MRDGKNSLTVSTLQAPALAGALETTARVASHLHPTGSSVVADHPVPTGREEIWRFTPLKRLRGLHADAEFQPSATAFGWTEHEGVTIRKVGGDGSGEERALRGVSGSTPTDRMTARILAEVPTTLLVDVEAEREVGEPIIVRLSGSDAKVTEAGHIVLRFGAHSKADVLLLHDGSASLAQVVEVVLGDGAQVTMTTVQDWAHDTVHLVHHWVHVGRDATLKHIAVSFGGDVVRLNVAVDYAGPGGRADLFGLYFADAGQHLEHRLFIDHNAPKTISKVDYKGALQGKGAHTVWVGDVLIRKVAEGIETYESNRNLVLTDGCRADSVPNLEIETGDIVGAGHASTTGRFDEEQLFYLKSRGIDETEARRLVVHGFFADIIRRIGVADLQERLMAEVEAELESVGTGAAFTPSLVESLVPVEFLTLDEAASATGPSGAKGASA